MEVNTLITQPGLNRAILLPVCHIPWDAIPESSALHKLFMAPSEHSVSIVSGMDIGSMLKCFQPIVN
jgi:hypothetical protein